MSHSQHRSATLFSAGAERRDAMWTPHGRVSALERGTETPVRLLQGFCVTRGVYKKNQHPRRTPQDNQTYLTVIYPRTRWSPEENARPSVAPTFVINVSAYNATVIFQKSLAMRIV
jgi:hypothetical protein